MDSRYPNHPENFGNHPENLDESRNPAHGGPSGTPPGDSPYGGFAGYGGGWSEHGAGRGYDGFGGSDSGYGNVAYPGYAGYGSDGAYASSPSSPPGEARPLIGLARAWEKFTAHLPAILVAVVIYLGLLFVAIGVVRYTLPSSVILGPLGVEGFPAQSLFVGNLAAVGIIIGGFFFQANVLRVALQAMDNKPITLGDFFRPTGLLRFVGISFLVGLLATLGLLALIVGAFVVAVLLCFSTLMVFDGPDSRPIAGSARLVQDNLGGVLQLFLGQFVLGIPVIVLNAVGEHFVATWILSHAVTVLFSVLSSFWTAAVYRQIQPTPPVAVR